MRSHTTNADGSFLILSLLIVTGLTALTTVSLTRSTTELAATNRFVLGQQAYFEAVSGIDCAIDQLRHTNVLDEVEVACLTADRTVTLTQDPGPPILISVTASSGSVSTTQMAIVQRTITSPFQHAIYGVVGDYSTGVKVSTGSVVDSYDSGMGAYGVGGNVASNGDVRTNSASNLNGTLAAIVVEDNGGAAAQVNGSASTPPGSTVYVAPGSSITGPIEDNQSVETFPAPVPPPPPPPAGCTPLNGTGANNGGDITITTPVPNQMSSCYYANNLTVTIGIFGTIGQVAFPNLQTLYVYGNLTINSTGVLRVGQGTIRAANVTVKDNGSRLEGTGTGGTEDGLVNIYLTGQLTASSDGVLTGAQNNPKRLRIYSTSSTTAANIASGGKVYGSLYAPNGLIQLTQNTGLSAPPNSSVHGAILGKTCMVTLNARLHYDEALKTVSTGWPAWMTTADVTVLAEGSNITLGN